MRGTSLVWLWERDKMVPRKEKEKVELYHEPAPFHLALFPPPFF